MRVALISDIHGNTVALDAVLGELDQLGVDQVVCLGDVAANGPDPSGAIERIASLDGVTVMGNTDAGLVDVPSWWHDPASVGIPESAWPGIEIGAWNAAHITSDDRRFLAALPVTAVVELGTTEVLCFHGSPSSYDDMITPATTEDDLDAMLGASTAAVLAGGHTHVPMVRRYRTQTIINPGSVGLPFVSYGSAGHVSVRPQAEYAVLTTEGTTASVDLRQVDVDLEALARQVEASSMPHAEWWINLWH